MVLLCELKKVLKVHNNSSFQANLIIGGLLSLIIAWITISFQAVKAAMRNPADSLRYE